MFWINGYAAETANGHDTYILTYINKYVTFILTVLDHWYMYWNNAIKILISKIAVCESANFKMLDNFT